MTADDLPSAPQARKTNLTPLPFRSDRPKPTLREQADLIRYLVDSYRAPSPGFDVSPIWISQSQVEDLRAIMATIRLFEFHGAGEYVRRQIEKRGAR